MCDMGYGNAPGPLDAGGPETLLTPGFIDAHNHWPQWDVVGYDGMTLLDWLDQVVFPAECTWADGSQARLQTSLALKSMIAAGTTGCAAFLTSHAQAVSAALDALNEYPVRCLIGRVLMDREAPDELCFACTGWSSADLGAPALAAGTMAQRVTLSVNPRFAVACSPEAADSRRSTGGGVRCRHSHALCREPRRMQSRRPVVSREFELSQCVRVSRPAATRYAAGPRDPPVRR
ncbi:MAG: amidohydrolase family protein [Planctomycetes bacterium]|nr:amidohydrolase family protein [Planctomycetota bacterium]